MLEPKFLGQKRSSEERLSFPTAANNKEKLIKLSNSLEILKYFEKERGLFFSILRTGWESNYFNPEAIQRLFLFACSLMKELEKSSKIDGITIISNIYVKVSESELKNAYIFEKDLIKNYHLATATHKTKKFVSIGDYEVSKVDENLGANYGFLAAVLDDEKKEVKIKSLELINKIGQIYKTFAEISFKYIVEMINDDEDEVRYETIVCLSGLLNSYKQVDQKTCEILYFCLNEKSAKLRRMLYGLLAKIEFKDFSSYKTLINVLCESLRNFSEDKLSIYDALKASLVSNSQLIHLSFLTEFLNLDKNFLFPENNWYDSLYTLKMIILQEYVKTSQETLSLPSFFEKHFYYFSSKYPKIFDKDFVSSHLKKKICPGLHYSPLDKSFEAVRTKLEFTIEEIYEIINSKLFSLTIDEIYSTLWFRLISIIINQINSSYRESVIKTLSVFIYITELINFKLNDLDCPQSKTLLQYNDSILNLFFSNIAKSLKISLEEQGSSDIKEIDKEKIVQNAKEIIDSLNGKTEKLIQTTFINPKNFFQYICPKFNLKFPYFINIKAKVKNASKESKILCDFFLLVEKKNGKKEEIVLNPANYEFSEKDKTHTLHCKLPLKVDQLDDLTCEMHFAIRSKNLERFEMILRTLSLKMRIDHMREGKIILASRTNIQVVIENL